MPLPNTSILWSHSRSPQTRHTPAHWGLPTEPCAVPLQRSLVSMEVVLPSPRSRQRTGQTTHHSPQEQPPTVLFAAPTLSLLGHWTMGMPVSASLGSLFAYSSSSS